MGYRRLAVSKILKVAIIGVGGISNTHIPGWNASGNAEIVALNKKISLTSF